MTSYFLARALRITIVGDSHSAMFQNLLFGARTRPDTTFVFNTQYLPDCRLGGLVAGGRLDGALYDALVRGLLILREHNLTPLSRLVLGNDGDRLLSEQQRPNGAVRSDETALVISAGHRDYLKALTELGPSCDFALPDVRHGPCPVDAVGTHSSVPVALVDALISPPIGAFCEAMGILVTAGFRRLSLLGLRPPPLDDESLERQWGVRSRAHLRYKLTMLMNDRLAQACARTGVDFIDTWPLLVKGGVFDDSCEFDFIHLNREGAIRVAQAIVDRYIELTATEDDDSTSS